MELIYSINFMMCRLPKISILYLFALVMLLYFDFALSISPQQTFSEHPAKNILEDIPTHNITSNINSPKPLCNYTLPDGLKTIGECNLDHSISNNPLSNQTVPHLNHPKESGTNLENSTISKNNVTTINSVKHICNGTSTNNSERRICSSEFPNVNQTSKSHLETNVTATLNSTKESNSTLVHINSTTGRTEIASLNDKSHKYIGGMDVDEKLNISTSHGNINSLKNDKNITSNIHGKKPETSDSNAFPLQRNDSSSKLLISTKAAGIAAAICVLMASAAYVSLMVWRRLSHNRYGNREMLINEDDLGDIHDEDMRHFEAACIQIET
ncbi:hypothetical protein O3M35_008402 [Rhynocoris fuscipes]|uniref:Uncharacterized protein n=1 Tax=Rhynocoris fuscipes TaxID=488301 RepID=A0AAW1D660_9HEMI